METSEFRNQFDTIAKRYGYTSAFRGWYKRSDECVLALELQKSSYSRLYYLNIYPFVGGYFNNYHKSDVKVTRDTIRGKDKMFFRREDKKYSPLFDLENNITNDKRLKGLETFFIEWLLPFTDKAITKRGMLKLIDQGQLDASKMNIAAIEALL